MVDKRFTVCLDTCTIFGEGIRRAKLLKQSIKPNKKKNEIKNYGTLHKIRDKTNVRFTSIITPYEFIRRLSKDEGINHEQARGIYNEILSDFKISEIVPGDEDNITPALMNKFLKCDLDFADGMQIHIASRRQIPFLTSENKKLENMKRFYEKTISVKDILKI